VKADRYEVLRKSGMYIAVCGRCLADWHIGWGAQCGRCGAIELRMGGMLAILQLCNPDMPADPGALMFIRPTWPRWMGRSPQDRDEPYATGAEIMRGPRLVPGLWDWPSPSTNAELRRN